MKLEEVIESIKAKMKAYEEQIVELKNQVRYLEGVVEHCNATIRELEHELEDEDDT